MVISGFVTRQGGARAVMIPTLMGRFFVCEETTIDEICTRVTEWCQLRCQVDLGSQVRVAVRAVSPVSFRIECEGSLKSLLALLLRGQRLERGWTQENLARRLTVAKSTVAAYELATREPSLTVLGRMLGALGLEYEIVLRKKRFEKDGGPFTPVAGRDGLRSSSCHGECPDDREF